VQQALQSGRGVRIPEASIASEISSSGLPGAVDLLMQWRPKLDMGALVRASASVGFDMNMRDHSNTTVLLFTVMELTDNPAGMLRAAEAMLESGADPNRNDMFGNTPLQYSMRVVVEHRPKDEEQ